MKKILVFLIILIGVLGAGEAMANDNYLITDSGAIMECTNLDLAKYYLSINCPGYIVDLSENREKNETLVKPRPLFFADTEKLTREIACFPSQVLMDNKCYDKKDLTGDICREVYGFEAQLDEIKKECVCHSGYELKEFSKNNMDCALKPVVKPAVQSAPKPVIEVPKEVIATPLVETPKPVVPIVTPVIEAPKQVEFPVVETPEPVVEETAEPEATTSEIVVPVAEREPVLETPSPEPVKQQNIIIRFFQAIANWWNSLWK